MFCSLQNHSVSRASVHFVCNYFVCLLKSYCFINLFTALKGTCSFDSTGCHCKISVPSCVAQLVWGKALVQNCLSLGNNDISACTCWLEDAGMCALNPASALNAARTWHPLLRSRPCPRTVPYPN